MKNSLSRLNGRLEVEGERVSKLEDRSVEITQQEEQSPTLSTPPTTKKRTQRK
jgi:hypothetical protein